MSKSRRRSVQATGPALASLVIGDTTPWYKKTHLLRLNFIIVSLVLFSSASGYDGSMMNGLMALPQWYKFMHNPHGAWLGFINAVQACAGIFINPIVAYSIQRMGRKIAIYVGYVFIIIATALQVAAPNPAAFVVARFLTGVAGAFWVGSVPLLITEIAYPTQRAIVTSLYNCGWYVGSILAAWTTFGSRNYQNDWSWKIPSLLQIGIPLICLPGVLMAPESPRYLVSKNRNEEARSQLVKHHNGGTIDAVVECEMEEIVTALRAEQEAKASTSWADLFRSKGNRHRAFISITLGVAAQWNGVGVVSYYLAMVLKTVGITSVTDQTLISGCLQIWNLIFAVTAAFLVDRLGRRKLFLSSCIGMLVSYIVITGLSGSFAQTKTASVGLAVIPMLFLYYASYDIAFTPLLFAYPCEIWPYQLRSHGLAATAISTQVAVAINIFVNPIALGAIGWKYYLVFVVILVAITFVCYFTYPETRGHSLEEMCVLFDGEDAVTVNPATIKERVASMSKEADHFEIEHKV